MSDYFLDDVGQGFSEGLGIAGKLQNLRQSRDEFELKKHSIQQQQQMIDDQMGLSETVGQQLAGGKFDATALYKKYPRAYREIQELWSQRYYSLRKI